MATIRTVIGYGAAIAFGLFVNTAVAGDIELTDAWSRPLPPVSRNGAAYVTVANRSGRDERIVGASATVAERAELHAHLHEDGLMKMRPVAGIDLPAGATVHFAPGGMHVMLLKLRSPLVAGEHYRLTLVMQSGKRVSTLVKVSPPDEIGAASHNEATGSKHEHAAKPRSHSN